MSQDNCVKIDPMIISAVDAIVADRKSWEANELLASNKRMYFILASVLRLIEKHKEHEKGLHELAKQRKLGGNAKTDLPLVVLKLVFGINDRQRLNAYAVVLRKAILAGKQSGELEQWIVDNGGIEAIRTSKTVGSQGSQDGTQQSVEGTTKPLTAAEKAQRAFEFLNSIHVALATIPPTPMTADASKREGYVLMLGRVKGDMSTDVVKFLNDPPALNAALAAIGNAVARTNGTPGDLVPFPGSMSGSIGNAVQNSAPSTPSRPMSFEDALDDALSA